ncbi:unnamed protein product [Clonostachys solani]|uniref:DUF1479-domain-containing protein n=1 Tax=Clonostachys solani TaxID=160281 RepID=A0A9N9Z9G2_9HYPO|nr:unnamed protein product [Clonostachys solani]
MSSIYEFISGIFSSEKQKAIKHWQFKDDLEKADLGDEFIQLKIDILSKYGVENIRKAWLSVTSALEIEAQTIKEQGTAIWPEVNYKDIENATVSEDVLGAIHRTGIVIVRNALPQAQATEWGEELVKYLNDNPTVIEGLPKQNPWLYRSYFSPTQNAVRTHTNSIKVHRFLNELWEGYDSEKAHPTPLSYADALRYRQPGGFSAVLQPHIDAGSLDRWADDEYQSFYSKIFENKWQEHKPFDIGARLKVNQAKFPGPHQSTVLRTFQGWTALSPSGGSFGQSALAVFPNVTLGVAYVLLRSFFKPPASGSTDPNLWELDISDSFPGAAKGLSQRISPSTHPHLRLDDTLSLTPQINPGDLVFWHPDIIHAVDPTLNSDKPATVLYIPSVPLKEYNLDYVKRQRDAFLDNGKTPPDFQAWFGQNEGVAKGWKPVQDFAQSNEARQSLGLEKLTGDFDIVKKANEVLGL